VPSLRKKIFYYKDYGTTTIDKLLPKDTTEHVPVLFADKFQSVILKNENGKLTMADLPIQAQFSPVFSIVKTDANQDGFDDIIVTGNLTQTRVLFGRYDANHGMLFLGNGKCEFTYVPQPESGLNIKGDVRSSLELNELLIFGVNADSMKVYKKNAHRNNSDKMQ
jgi:hypothetical protein